MKLVWGYFVKKYIVLLRGINISGKNKVPMKELKNEIEKLKFSNVITYLYSGNVIFKSDIEDENYIKNSISKIIKNKFNLNIPIYIMTEDKLKNIMDNVPSWCGVDNFYDNVIFVIPPKNCKDVHRVLGAPNYDLEKVVDYEDVIFWSYNLKQYTKTNWWSRTASTTIKDDITIRKLSTVEKILKITESL